MDFTMETGPARQSVLQQEEDTQSTISSYNTNFNNNGEQMNRGNRESLDSPLDFSTKKAKIDENGYDSDDADDPDSVSPCSRLRNVLTIQSPELSENHALNLSKESPNSGWVKSESRSSSSSCSPTNNDQHHMYLGSPRPGASAAPAISLAASHHGGVPSMSFSPYAGFSQSLSPIMTHGSRISFPFDTNSPMFPHHISASAASPSLPYGSGMPMPHNGTTPTSRGRTTRPFKAYPKDPLTFPTAGLYGLPMGAAPGSTEALIHQQSNHAYAEFRKQMLAHTIGSKSRRGGQRSGAFVPINSDSTTSSNEPLNFGLREIGANSSADESQSEDGAKSREKTEQQFTKLKDEAYWERRRKNNEAAKRSRDARRAKEDEIAIRAAFLEQENLKLRFELCTLKTETNKLRCLLYNYNAA